MESLEMKTLIIPDVHGRTFWKISAEEFLKDNSESKIVFLGDYLDPYDGEGISQETAMENFAAIIDFKKAHDKNIVLLMGNHDMHYMSSEFGECSRYDAWRAPRIKKMFDLNKELFQMAYLISEANKRIIISHAGIQKNWVNECFGEESIIINDNNVVEYMNARFDEYKANPDSIFAALLDIMSPIRGGFFHKHGSMVWADCTEYLRSDTEIYGDYQIFGHTRVKIPALFKNWACLDCSRAFLLEDGVLKELDGTALIIKEFKDSKG